ncbi:MAG TPA: DUF2231 domain-containing protein [Anaerolineales bacterium]|nr:DUF2231 domain-containing protein [Anaerolineales bacterium]
MLKALLQGKPIGHPLHPALVHFPIGLFVLSLLLDIASYLGIISNNLFRTSLYTMGFGVALGVLAVLTGLVDRSDIRLDHPARKTSTIHMVLNLTGLGLFGLNFFLRLGQSNLTVVALPHLLLSLVGVGTILVSGYLGGTMVYDNGIGVGRHRRYTRTPRKTIDVSFLIRHDGWAPVCEEDELHDGESLRVKCDGNIIAIARQGGEVYAFQEFCTHRYGPLSEGKLQDHQVICPWHRSCFDIRSGKVVEGPAKVDLKTYSAKIRDGKIFVK